MTDPYDFQERLGRVESQLASIKQALIWLQILAAIILAVAIFK